MSQPYPILVGPLTVWTGPVGETFTDVDTTPAGNWDKLGQSGDRNYAEDGVTINNPQTVALIRMLGGTGPVKASRSEEDLIISLILHDWRATQIALAMNGNTPVNTPAASGTPGYDTLGLYKGVNVTQYALLVRGKSPEDDVNWNMQFEVPVCVVTGSPSPVFKKGDPAGVAIEFTAIEDWDASSEDERFGRLIIQDATAEA